MVIGEVVVVWVWNGTALLNQLFPLRTSSSNSAAAATRRVHNPRVAAMHFKPMTMPSRSLRATHTSCMKCWRRLHCRTQSRTFAAAAALVQPGRASHTPGFSNVLRAEKDTSVLSEGSPSTDPKNGPNFPQNEKEPGQDGEDEPAVSDQEWELRTSKVCYLTSVSQCCRL